MATFTEEDIDRYIKTMSPSTFDFPKSLEMVMHTKEEYNRALSAKYDEGYADGVKDNDWILFNSDEPYDFPGCPYILFSYLHRSGCQKMAIAESKTPSPFTKNLMEALSYLYENGATEIKFKPIYF